MTFKHLMLTAATALSLLAPSAWAADTVKVGLILPMTGPFASTGREIEAAVRTYMAERGTTVAGKTIELVVKDDTGTPDVTKRIAQELVVNEGVDVLAGFGLTPLALAAAPIATQGKKVEVVMAAATATITEASPYVVRTSFTGAQAAAPLADWADAAGIKNVITLVSDYAPGIDIEKAFTVTLQKHGGKVENLRVPLKNPDFAPFLQKVADAKPQALLAFVPSGIGAQFMKQFVERGMDKSGIRLIATGDVTDDDLLNSMGDVALGVVTSHHYSAAHDSAVNKAFVKMFKEKNGFRPNFMAVGGYDGMHLIYTALEKTGGKADGDSLIAAMKGLAWESPRGPVSIDPETRDIIQNIYIREVKKGADGELYNEEFYTWRDVKDPAKAGKLN